MKKSQGRKERRNLAKRNSSRRGEIKTHDKKAMFHKNWKKYKAKKKLARRQRKENRSA